MKKLRMLVVLAVAAMLSLAACSNHDEPFMQKTYEADGTQIREIRMDVRDRQIEVSLSADHQIHIDYFENSREYYDISVSDSGVLTMKAVVNKEWTEYIGGKAAAENRKISLQIPDALLSSLKLSTTNEDILLSAVTVTDTLSVSQNGGNLIFDKVNAGKAIVFTAKNGNISGTIVGGYDDYDIACEIKKGKSNLPADKKGGEKELRVSANNGDVTIDFYKS